MKEYHVEILETLRKIVKIEAESSAEAVELVRDRYNDSINPEYILTSDDYLDTEFTAVDPENDFSPIPISFNE